MTNLKLSQNPSFIQIQKELLTTKLSVQQLRALRKQIDEEFKIKIKQKVEENKKRKWKNKKIARPVFFVSDSSDSE
jgi:hypothetical protein